MVYVWLGLIVAFIAVEAATVNLVSIWFIGGAVAGLVCDPWRAGAFAVDSVHCRIGRSARAFAAGA